LRQKLEYKDQIETEEMTPGIILTLTLSRSHHFVTATWHDELGMWQIFLFFKKI